MRTYVLCLLILIVSIISKAQNNSKLIDINGNTYKTIEIGKYIWTAENLRTTSYNDGTEIPYISKNDIWVQLKSGAYCWYNNDTINLIKYGVLYNWYAVNTNKLCPDGWRIPSDEEWKYLEGFVDSKYNISDTIWNGTRNRGFDAGFQLKSNKGWKREGNGPNSFGFNALPGGERCSTGKFFQEEISGFWWSNTEGDSIRAWYRNIFYDYELVYREIHPKHFGFSVRCITDK